MPRNIYAIHDILVGAYLPPFLGDSDARVIRDFGDIVVKCDTPVSKHPSDYVLECIGSFDEVTGVISPCPIKVIAHAADFVTPNGAEKHE